MGGTTAKLCVIEKGEPAIAHEFEVDRIYRFKKGSGLPVKVPVIEMIEIGAGGGSIARVDSLGLLKVGPDQRGCRARTGLLRTGRHAADASPMPTSCSATSIPTSSSAVRWISISRRPGPRSARTSQSRSASPSSDAAFGIHQVVNESMANAARVHVLERGGDPRRLPLFVFGGAGPVHGFRVARALGSPRLIAPLGAGVMSTLGFLAAPLAFDFSRSWRAGLGDIDAARANALLDEMESEGDAILRSSGVADADITHRRVADMRYVGQGHEVRVELPG